MIRRPPRSTLFPYTTLFRSAVGRGIGLAEKRLEPGGVVRLRQPYDRGVFERRARDDGEVELGAKGRLNVPLEVDALLLEAPLDLPDRLLPARELLRQRVDLLPLARAEVAVGRDEDERVGADERGAGGVGGAGFRASATGERKRQRYGDTRCEVTRAHSRVGSRPIRLAANSFRSVPSSTLHTPSVIGSSMPSL